MHPFSSGDVVCSLGSWALNSQRNNANVRNAGTGETARRAEPTAQVGSSFKAVDSYQNGHLAGVKAQFARCRQSRAMIGGIVPTRAGLDRSQSRGKTASEGSA